MSLIMARDKVDETIKEEGVAKNLIAYTLKTHIIQYIKMHHLLELVKRM